MGYSKKEELTFRQIQLIENSIGGKVKLRKYFLGSTLAVTVIVSLFGSSRVKANPVCVSFNLGSSFYGTPAVGYRGDTIHVVTHGPAHNVWDVGYVPSTGQILDWRNLKGQISGSPIIAGLAGFEVIALGRNSDGSAQSMVDDYTDARGWELAPAINPTRLSDYAFKGMTDLNFSVSSTPIGSSTQDGVLSKAATLTVCSGASGVAPVMPSLTGPGSPPSPQVLPLATGSACSNVNLNASSYTQPSVGFFNGQIYMAIHGLNHSALYSSYDPVSGIFSGWKDLNFAVEGPVYMTGSLANNPILVAKSRINHYAYTTVYNTSTGIGDFTFLGSQFLGPSQIGIDYPHLSPAYNFSINESPWAVTSDGQVLLNLGLRVCKK